MRRLVALTTFVVLLTSMAVEARVMRGKRPIPGRYIVALNTNFPGPPDEVRDDLIARFGGRVVQEFRYVLQAFVIEANEGQAEAISHDPRVSVVEQDSLVEVAQTGPPPSWALDRIDERMNPRLDGSFEACMSGTSITTVFAYVIDTGIWAAHDEFSNLSPYNGQARVQEGYDLYWAKSALYTNQSTNPCWDETSQHHPTQWASNATHGTAVASAIGGRTLGVVPDVMLRPVRAMPCSGVSPVTDILAAAEWIRTPCVDVANDPKRCDTRYIPGLPRIVNMSFTYALEEEWRYGPLSTVDQAVQNLIASGILVVAAAGNFDSAVGDRFSPARVPAAITVGATQGHNTYDIDARWISGGTGNLAGSNYGERVDVFAPGHFVRVADFGVDGLGNRNRVREINHSGTSFSAGYVTGAAARQLWITPGYTPLQLHDYIVSNATNDVQHQLNILNRGAGSPNRLLYKAGCRPRTCCSAAASLPGITEVSGARSHPSPSAGTTRSGFALLEGARLKLIGSGRYHSPEERTSRPRTSGTLDSQ